MNRRFRTLVALVVLVYGALWGYTSAQAAEAWKFVQMCDTQLGMGGYDHDVAMFKLAVEQINELKPDFVIICGDLVHDNYNEQAYKDFNAINGSFEIPSYPAPGNHDVGKNPTLESLEAYRKTIGEDYYAFEHKGVAFILVNTQLWKSPLAGESEKHDLWFEEELKKARDKDLTIFVAGHFPPYIRDPEEKENYGNLPIEARRRFLGQLKTYKVAAYLAGHIHRNNIVDYGKIQLVASATTSRNVGSEPMGYRVWTIGKKRPYKHRYTPLEGSVPAKGYPKRAPSQR